MRIYCLLATAFLATIPVALPAMAGETLSGKGSVSFSATDGNTQTTNLEAQLQLSWKTRRFLNEVDVTYGYGYVSGQKTYDRTDGTLGLGWRILPWVVTSARIRVLTDPFAGYDARIFVGLEGKIIPLDRNSLQWDISISPGVIFEKAETGDAFREVFSLSAHSRLIWSLTERIILTADADAIYSEISTIITGRAALEFPIIGSLAIGIEATGSYNTDPPADIIPWDIKTGGLISVSF